MKGENAMIQKTDGISESYCNAIEQASSTICSTLQPIWWVVRHTPWKNDFLGNLFKWGALCGDVPVAIVPLSASACEAIVAIRSIILQKRQRFPIPKKLIWRALKRAGLDGLSGFQANVATCGAISQLIGDGFVAFPDQARLYPQYASKHIDKLREHWSDFSSDSITSVKEGFVALAIIMAKKGAEEDDHLTLEYHVRARRANKRLNDAYAYQKTDVRPVRKWLEFRFPQYTWDDWYGSGYKGTSEVISTLEKVNAYVDRKDSAQEMRGAWAQHQRVNDERLSLWRSWWADTILPLLV